MGDYIILHTNEHDREQINQLFEHAILYQKKNGHPVWPGYDQDILREDIVQKRQYKLVQKEKLAAIFSIDRSDKEIWNELDKDPAIYIHRVVTHPAHKGKRLFSVVLNWIVEYAKLQSVQLLRMDTWANNLSLIKYYESYGFRFVRYYQNPSDASTPIHIRGNKVILLQLNVNENVDQTR